MASPSPTATITTAVVGGPGTRPGASGGAGTTGGGGQGGNNGINRGGSGLSFASFPIPGPFIAYFGTTIGGILLFLFLVRRRREDAPSLATFVFESPAVVVPPIVTPLPPTSVVPPPADASPDKDPEPPKRKRGRKAGQPAAAAIGGAAASAFAKRPAKGVERVFVTYKGVRMGATPDDVQPMVARLERGDEIEIIGSQEGHLNVRTPSGLTGWIPRGTVTGTRPSTPGSSTPAQN